MPNSVSRETIDAFYAAYFYHDAGKVAEYLHDDVSWTITGPVDVLSYCGTRRGKAAVLDLIGRIVPSVFRVVNFVQDSILMDGDRVATLNRLSGRRRDDGRAISYRLAHFMRFRDGKVIENISLMDSFDAVEQVLGHSLLQHETCAANTGDLVAV
jgi:ketosteroid isomerase-like protein